MENWKVVIIAILLLAVACLVGWILDISGFFDAIGHNWSIFVCALCGCLYMEILKSIIRRGKK